MRYPYFSPREIHGGMQAVAIATRLAEQRRDTGKQDSLSQN